MCTGIKTTLSKPNLIEIVNFSYLVTRIGKKMEHRVRGEKNLNNG